MAPYTVFSISVLSAFLGRDFYLLRPQALLLCIPTLSLLILLKTHWDDSRDDKIETLIKREKKPARKPGLVLSVEENIYFFIYFISDTLTFFELCSILFPPLFNLSAYYLYTYLLPASIVYALYIQIMHREPDFRDRYEKIATIMQGHQPSFPFSSLFYTAITLLSATMTMALSNIPVLFVASFLLSVYLSVYYYKQHFHALYSLYLLYFCLGRLQNFQRLLLRTPQLLALIQRYPVVLNAFPKMTTGVAGLYAIAYYNSTATYQHLTEKYDSPSKKIS